MGIAAALLGGFTAASLLPSSCVSTWAALPWVSGERGAFLKVGRRYGDVYVSMDLQPGVLVSATSFLAMWEGAPQTHLAETPFLCPPRCLLTSASQDGRRCLK